MKNAEGLRFASKQVQDTFHAILKEIGTVEGEITSILRELENAKTNFTVEQSRNELLDAPLFQSLVADSEALLAVISKSPDRPGRERFLQQFAILSQQKMLLPTTSHWTDLKTIERF